MADYLALMVNEQEQPAEACEIVATLGWVGKLPLDYDGKLQWQRIDIAKVGFGMLKVLEMRHPEHSSKVIQLHLPGEHDLEVRLSLEPGEEVVGFQVKEVKDGGASEFYDPQVLIRDATAVRMEPLSQHFFKPSPEFPGKLRWLPATAQPDPEGKVQGSEVVGFRTMQGVQRDHILGVVQKVSFSAFVRSWTGQSLMFWIDIFLLVLVLYYADILLDLKQLKVFADQRLYDYLRFNALGLLIPPVVTVWEACHWLQQPSPERDHFDHLVRSKLMQKIIIVLAVATQTHVILLVMWSVRFKQKHPLLQGAKNAEVAESAISALVQMNFLVSHFAGVTAITDRNLDSATLQIMAVSILVSCCSTGLSFAGKDKKDGSVLGLPGKVDWSPTMVSLVLVRALETASRMVAFNIVQVSLRGGWCGHLGGPMAVLLFVAAAALCFPEAEISDVLASVVAHPGQILEPQSLLPLWRSLVLHALLVLVALLPQVLLRTEYNAWMPKDAKEIPAIYLLGWLAVTACSFLGLMILYLLGRRLKQPIFEQLREGDERGGSIPLSSFIAAFAGKQGQVPKAAAAALGDDVVRVDIANLDKVTLTELMTSQCPVSFSPEAFKHLIRLYAKDTDFKGDKDNMKSAEIAPAIEEVMSDLALCNVVHLYLNWCSFIPSAAWQRLHGADWQNLKIARFVSCFGNDSKGVDGAADLLEVLGKATTLEELVFDFCSQIPAAAWQRLHGADWRNLKIAYFCKCFGDNSKGVDGAADLLEVLGKATTLKMLVFSSCSQIPAAAWQRVPSGAWPKLKPSNAFGIPAEELQRFGAPSGGVTSEQEEDREVATKVAMPGPSRLKVVRADNLEANKGDALLQGLSQSTTLETLVFHFCYQIPAAAWQRLHGADCRNLKIASFYKCFGDDSKGVDGAADLLQVLGKATTLETLVFSSCSQIPAAAWQRLHGADWRNLKIARFYECFGDDSKGVDGAADLLQVLGQATTLETLAFDGCSQIPAAAWQRLHVADWRNLKIASFDGCFGHDSKGVDGAADLLEVLGKATTLETLAFHRCNQIPAAAWQRVPSGAWPKLKPSKTPGVPEEELQRICGDGRPQ